VTLHGATGMSQFGIRPAIITRWFASAKHSRIHASMHRTSAGNFSKGAPNAGAKRVSPLPSPSRNSLRGYNARWSNYTKLDPAIHYRTLTAHSNPLPRINTIVPRSVFAYGRALSAGSSAFHEAFCKLPRMIRVSVPCLGTRPATFSPLVCVYLEPREQFPELI